VSDTASKPKKIRKPNVGSDATKGGKLRLWQVGLYAFAIGVTLILIAINISYVVRGEFPRITLAATILIGGLSWGLLKKETGVFADSKGLKIANAEPDLQAFIGQIADEVGVDGPDDVYLVSEARLALTEATRQFGRTVDGSSLIIGMPNLHALTRQEFAAALAHEFAHHAESGIEAGPETLRSLRSAREIIRVERQGFVNGVYGSYARKMFRGIGGVGVAQEEFADRLAAERYGTEALLGALRKEDETKVAFDQLLREYVVPGLQNHQHPELMYQGFEHVLASPARAEQRDRDLTRHQDRDRSEFLLHRKAALRLAMVEAWDVMPAQVQVEQADALAATLLSPDAKSSEIVVGTWATGLTDHSTEPTSWQDLTEQVYVPNASAIAALPFDEDDESTAGDRLEQALEWSASGDWDDLDRSIKKELKKKRFNNSDARRIEWARCVVLDVAAQQDGHRWKHDWDGPPMLVNASGSALDAEPIAAMIAEGKVDQARDALDSILQPSGS